MQSTTPPAERSLKITRRVQVALLTLVALVLLAAVAMLGLYGVASSRGPLPPPAFTEADLPQPVSGVSPWEHGNWEAYGDEPIVEEPPQRAGRRRRYVRSSATELIPPIDASTRQALGDSVGAQNIAAHAEEFSQALEQRLELTNPLTFLSWVRTILIAASLRFDAGEETLAFTLLASLLDREAELARSNRGGWAVLGVVIAAISETLTMIDTMGEARGGLPSALRQRAQALLDQPLDLAAPNIALFLELRAMFERSAASPYPLDRLTFDPEETGHLLNEHARHCVAFSRDRTYLNPPRPQRSWRSGFLNPDGQELIELFDMEDAEPFTRCGGVESIRRLDDAMRAAASDVSAQPILE